MILLLLTKDLFFLPTVKAEAQQHGFQVRCESSLKPPPATPPADEKVGVCVVDLNCAPLHELPDLFSRLRDVYPQAKLIAFGPHVQIERLNAAKHAACDAVLTRGQVTGQLGKLLAEVEP